MALFLFTYVEALITDMGTYQPGNDVQASRFLLEQSIRHAWDWFALHANQRMQGVNFFLLAAAFLTAAYVNAMQYSKPLVALGVAALGVWFCVVFYRFELRIRELIKVGEKALSRSQEKLSQLTGLQEFEICKMVETPKHLFTSYHKVISALYALTGVAFAVGGGYALYSRISPTPKSLTSKDAESLLAEATRILLVLAALLSLYWARRLVLKAAGARDWLNCTIAIVFAVGGVVVLVLCARAI